jgi:hypothetical protein
MHHVFVDFENVQDIDLGGLGDDPVELTILLGQDQKPPPSRLLASLVERAGSVRLVKMQRAGRNALDMTLASQVGEAAARDPSGRFHIISEDTDYDPLVEHLRRVGIDAVRVGKSAPPPPPPPVVARPGASRPEVRPPATSRAEARVAAPPEATPATVDKATNVANRLRRSANPPSRKVRLLSHIRDQLKGRLREGEDAEILRLLVESGFVAIDARNRVTYPGLLP